MAGPPNSRILIASSTLREVAWFVVAGGVNAAAYLLVSYLAFALVTKSAIVATTAGYIAAVIVSFVLNAVFTFEKGRVTSIAQASKFAALYVIGYGYNLLVIGAGAEVFGFPFLAMVALVTVTWPVCSFLLSKFVVFT